MGMYDCYYRVEIIFYNGQKLECKLENLNLVTLQLMVKNRKNTRKDLDRWFDKEGVLLDVKCVMSIKETEIDEDIT